MSKKKKTEGNNYKKNKNDFKVLYIKIYMLLILKVTVINYIEYCSEIINARSKLTSKIYFGGEKSWINVSTFEKNDRNFLSKVSWEYLRNFATLAVSG